MKAQQSQGGVAKSARPIECISYYCKVKLSLLVALRRAGAVCIEASPSAAELTQSTLSTRTKSSTRGPSSVTASFDIKARRLTQLKHSKLNKLFRAKDTVWLALRGICSSSTTWSNFKLKSSVLSGAIETPLSARRKRRLMLFFLYATDLTGFSIPGLHLILSSTLSDEAATPWTPIVGFVATSTFCGAFLIFY